MKFSTFTFGPFFFLALAVAQTANYSKICPSQAQAQAQAQAHEIIPGYYVEYHCDTIRAQ